ncbi:MAG: ornithine carbamoyltransferase [Candidatus Diapherotrites archaeon]|nr:ornithine carbamoyltransferase [Candidatus Diapherotrites archaeon]
MKHLLNITDLKKEEILYIIDKAIEIKNNPEKYAKSLEGKTLLMMFEKPSLRTRLSFETGMTQLGGHAIFYSFKDSPLGKKETISDTAKCASRFVDIVMIRAYKQSQIREFAENASVPVIDALSDMAHPCQIMADLQTMKEKGKDIEHMKLAYLGNGNNNVTFDLMRACAVLGSTCYVGCPADEEFNVPESVLDECSKYPGKIVVTHDAEEAARDADVIYTDTWVNYGIPVEELEERARKLKPYQVNQHIMSLAKPDAIFMNCLPAMRGYEQTADVIDGPQSVVFDEAENRLHAQKAIMLFLLGKL